MTTEQTAATECAFADEGCTCGRPRLTLTEAQARMAATPKPGPTFATYLDRQDRDHLDARAACAEAERDEALDARDVLRVQLDTARRQLGAATDALATIRDAAERIDRALAVYDTQPEPTSGEPKTDLPHAWDTFDPDTYRRVGQWFAQAARAHDEDGDTATARHATWAAAVFGAYDEETPAVQPSSVPPRRMQEDDLRPVRAAAIREAIGAVAAHGPGVDWMRELENFARFVETYDPADAEPTP